MIKKLPILLSFLLLAFAGAMAQQQLMNRLPRGGGMGQRGAQGGDSLHHRTGMEDSITINFRYLDTSRYHKFDSAISDFSLRYPVPADYLFLGNLGTAAKSLLFSPIMQAGWDPGFHAFDIYRFKMEDTRFFNTTRPYSELGYLLGSKSEQLVHVLHTQNINPNWNVAFQFRMINSPGFFKNQNTSSNAYRLNSFYQSPNRRYHLFFILSNSKIQASENGGITNTNNLDSLPEYKERTTIPVHLGPVAPGAINPFNTTVNTGNKYSIRQFMLRQQYDLGKKDSVQTDTTVIHLFYPKLRLEHSFQYNNYTYSFADAAVTDYNDTGFYRPFYHFLSMPSTFRIQDKWDEMVNDFSLYQFPDSKNPQQFFKAGASLQQLKGVFDGSASNYYNSSVHGEYRNKTRNQKWDVEATGQLYLAGFNSGDYNAYGSLKRLISNDVGYLQLGFQDVNRTPSFIFNSASSFNFEHTGGFKKENTLRFFGSIEQPRLKLKLSGNYYLVTNYSYFRDYYHPEQATALFNLLQVSAEKTIHLRRHLVWIAELTLQQRAGNGPVNVPLLFTRNRIGYEGSLGYKNLQLATGFEIKYNTPYKADGYSPLTGQFYYQDTSTISPRLPTINGYFHFRIRSFTAYVRLENLNTARNKQGFGFTNNNLAAPGYPYPGMQFRVGIFWSFVN